jgi:MoxR-like ATPase
MTIMSDENTEELSGAGEPEEAVSGASAEAAGLLQRIRETVGAVFFGQAEVVDQVLAAFVSGGHVLLEGKPGLGKTHLVLALARTFGGVFRRIQFTPDLLPGDVTGHTLYDMGRQEFRLRKGPVFTNLLLADEINRAPAKTQAALLEVMQETQVTIDGETLPLPPPFMTLATQNPIEQEGTFPLPEAQLDRFMFNIHVGYPTAAEEQAIIRQVTGTKKVSVEKLLDGKTVMELQDVVRRVPVADHVVEYAATLVRATRPKEADAPDFVKEMVGWGAGPRAGIYLITAAKARAILQGRFHATTADVQHCALPVLRHRILTTFNAEAAGVKSKQ